jgi:hypothetical protein
MFVEAKGGVTAIGIPGERNPGRMYSHHTPDDTGTPYA